MLSSNASWPTLKQGSLTWGFKFKSRSWVLSLTPDLGFSVRFWGSGFLYGRSCVLRESTAISTRADEPLCDDSLYLQHSKLKLKITTILQMKDYNYLNLSEFFGLVLLLHVIFAFVLIEIFAGVSIKMVADDTARKRRQVRLESQMLETVTDANRSA